MHWLILLLLFFWWTISGCVGPGIHPDFKKKTLERVVVRKVESFPGTLASGERVESQVINELLRIGFEVVDKEFVSPSAPSIDVFLNVTITQFERDRKMLVDVQYSQNGYSSTIKKKLPMIKRDYNQNGEPTYDREKLTESEFNALKNSKKGIHYFVSHKNRRTSKYFEKTVYQDLGSSKNTQEFIDMDAMVGVNLQIVDSKTGVVLMAHSAFSRKKQLNEALRICVEKLLKPIKKMAD